MSKKYILSFDQGTTSSRAILFDEKFKIAGIQQQESTQIFPRSGWVEQNAMEILDNQISVAQKLIRRLKINTSDIAALGITNQRETTIVWDKNTGKPIYNAIIWQDKRTENYCTEIKSSDMEKYILDTTGLIIDSYFSATKIHWILNNVENVKEMAEQGNLLFGTVDTWLIWNLSGHKLHITDCSNASRTMLYNIHTQEWDEKILNYFGIPKNILPQVVDSSSIYGYTDSSIFGESIAIGGIAGDQQAALFGQACFEKSTVKNTYGTGCFMLMNTGENAVKSTSGLITTIAWRLNGKVSYALEGSVFVAGAAIQWLRDKLKIIASAAETEQISKEIKNTDGVYFVPAFVGLGAPYWNMNARGVIVGISSGTTYRHIVRAALESMAYQTKDVLNAMEKDSKMQISSLAVDGGASANNFLLQFQSDILGIDVVRPEIIESTALGAAYLAALSVGMCTTEEIIKNRKLEEIFTRKLSKEAVDNLYNGWINAVAKAVN